MPKAIFVLEIFAFKLCLYKQPSGNSSFFERGHFHQGGAGFTSLLDPQCFQASFSYQLWKWNPFSLKVNIGQLLAAGKMAYSYRKFSQHQELGQFSISSKMSIIFRFSIKTNLQTMGVLTICSKSGLSAPPLQKGTAGGQRFSCNYVYPVSLCKSSEWYYKVHILNSDTSKYGFRFFFI